MFFCFKMTKKKAISKGEGASIRSHAHLDFIVLPHPFLKNLPYGAEIKKRSTKTIIAKLKIRINE
jgi:hypothetical protein